jgi:alkylation response protein AidB-like acyl-CoA dehydrogenase
LDFNYDSDQQALRKAVNAMLARAYGQNQRRTVVAADPGFDGKTWARLAEMGVLGLPFAEEDGGADAGPVDVAIAAEEMGRVLAPEPFIETVVLAGGLVAKVGTAEQRAEILSAVSEGRCVLAFAHAEPGSRWSVPASAVQAIEDGGSWRLAGVKEPVPHGARADSLVVSAVAGGTTRLFFVGGDAEGLARTGYRTHDGGRAARITFNSTPARLLGDEGADRAGDIARAQAAARIAYANEAVGVMDTALRMTVDYLKTRKQFGVTLSKLQSLTFRAADMYVSLELARSTALWAVLVQDAGGDVVQAADRARLQTSRAGRHIGKEAIQLHGGIGMTAEYKIGHYTSRLTAIDHVLGDGDWALARLAVGIDAYQTVDPLGVPYA